MFTPRGKYLWANRGTWSELKTPLRKWSAEKGFEYLHVIDQDVTFHKPTVMREVADQLTCNITGIADPHQRIDLAKASPFVREWAEGVFVWLSKHDVQERKKSERT